MSDLGIKHWRRLLDHLDEPTVGQVAEALANARDFAIGDAYDRVEEAVDAGDLVEEDDGGLGTVRVPDDTPQVSSENTDDEDPGISGEDGEERAEDGEISGSTPTPDTVEMDELDAGAGYLDIFRRAQAIGGREAWEYVTEDELRTALAEAGHERLLDTGTLGRTSDWRRADLAEAEDKHDWRWFYAPAGLDPRPEEFRRFHESLMAAAPDDYEPYYFRVEKAGKAPATEYGSWKDEVNRLSFEEAVDHLESGGNIGIAGTPEDSLVNIDIDDGEATTPDDLVETLRARSRSRGGWHAWAFNPEGDIPNLPTDDLGEVRTDWQYVVAPGSFVASAGEEIPDGADNAGFYTVEHEATVPTITYDDLPQAFREWEEQRDEELPPQDSEDGDDLTGGNRDDGGDTGTSESAVFDITAEDVARKEGGDTDTSKRWTALFHGSDTSANMSVSGEGKIQCWRHNVAHGGLQALATLSDKSSGGCQAIGTGHKHSNAGGCRYKNDWRLVWWAWEYAKDSGYIPDDDPIPYKTLLNLAVRDGVVDRDDLVERDSEDGGTYLGFPDASAYNAALEHVRDTYDREPGREEASAGSGGDEDYTTDPRDLDVVLDPRRAWEAAGRVTPDDLDEVLAQSVTDDGEAWLADGERVDVVRGVAVTDLDVDADATLDTDTYDRAYRRARERYGAPLPEYVTEGDAADRYEVIIGAVRALDFFDLDPSAFAAEVTDADEGGDVVHYLDPTPVDGWRDSESGESVVVFDSGTVWDGDTEETIDALRLVALDSGLIDDPTERLAGDAFQVAYRRAREDYGAPLPRWAIGATPDHTPVLPPADDLVDAVDPDEDLKDAREDVEALYRSLARGEADAPVSILRALPSLGKTTSAIKSAGEGIPTTYLAPRKELMEQAAAKADRWGASSAYLPVFGGGDINDIAVSEAVATVREDGKDLLRNPWGLLDRVEEPVYEEGEEAGTSGDEDVDLDRATCPCAEGEHGEAWAIAVHTARELDYTPRDIHERAEALFGTELPCQEDSGECEYSAGWDRVSDPDAPLDLLIGSYGHAHVESARTHYSRDERDTIDRTERAVVLDEFVGDAFTEEFGDEFVDHAVWLARALRADVEDRQDLFNTDLWGDEWVRAWLRGDGDETEAEPARTALWRLADLLDAVDAAEDLLDGYDDFVENHDLREPLETVRDEATALDGDTAGDLAATIRARCAAIGGQRGGRLVQWITDDVVDPLDDFAGGDPLDLLPDAVGGDLLALVEDAVEAARAGHNGSESLLRAAATALEGGEAGCREVAVHADDGYAHRLAHRLLEGVIAPSGEEGVAEVIETSAFAYAPDEDGARIKHVHTGDGEGRDTVLVDRNHNGATVLSPPSRTAGNGEECPTIGLDATARKPLWRLMLGYDVELADIHDSHAERARFLRDDLGLKVVRAGQRARPYEGDPGGKDLDGDVALIQEIADQFSGWYTADERDEGGVTVGNPAVITTKCVRDVLEGDERLDDTVAAWDNYGNITGDNDLGHHRLAAILGTQHYGHHAVEKVAALAGEEVTPTGRGAALDYGSTVANTYLKHMREDQTMQAILRFTRGGSGAVVFARTSSLRRDLPVVGEGRVVKSWSGTATAIAREWRRHGGERFTVADVADAVDVTREQVRRILDEFVAAGHLEKHETGAGLANEFSPGEDPSAGAVDLPSVEVDPHTSRKGDYYTANVGVWPIDSDARTRTATPGTPLPAPDTADEELDGPPTPS